jgi:hypothetical protein
MFRSLGDNFSALRGTPERECQISRKGKVGHYSYKAADTPSPRLSLSQRWSFIPLSLSPPHLLEIIFGRSVVLLPEVCLSSSSAGNKRRRAMRHVHMCWGRGGGSSAICTDEGRKEGRKESLEQRSENIKTKRNKFYKS